jgi:hypothetical protein
LNLKDRAVAFFIKQHRERVKELFLKPALADPAGHQRNVANLFRGLNEGAASRLSKILKLRERIFDDAVHSYREIYMDDEYAEYEKYENFTHEISEEASCFRWKQYKLPSKNFESGVFLYNHGIKLLKTVSSIGKKVIIDVGGFIADSVLVLHNAFPESPIYSFEPNNANFVLARTTLKINALDTWGGGKTGKPCAW